MYYIIRLIVTIYMFPHRITHVCVCVLESVCAFGSGVNASVEVFISPHVIIVLFMDTCRWCVAIQFGMHVVGSEEGTPALLKNILMIGSAKGHQVCLVLVCTGAVGELGCHNLPSLMGVAGGIIESIFMVR